MEEILASIRRIIADDDASKSGPRAAEPPKPAPRPAPPPPRILPEPVPPALHVSEEPAEAAAADPFSEPVEEESSDILDLTESMAAPAFEPAPPPPPSPPPAAPASAPPQFRKIEALSDVGFDEGEPKQAAPRNDAPSFQLGAEQGLLSRETSAAVDSAFNALAQTVLVQNARTLEDLVREMLRPMLKSWLDDNLPGMVERLVRAEIERVARGR
jgi:cell pole-organizing protein PopZ